MSRGFLVLCQLVLVAAASATGTGTGTLTVPSVLSDDMVLAASPRQARLWGTADPDATITVAIAGAMNDKLTAKASATGAWEIGLPPVQPSLVPSDVTITSSTGTSSTPIRLLRVLFGDIIVCGGQSNMQFSLNLAFNGTAEIAAAGQYAKNLRLLTVARVTSTKPEGDAKLQQKWTVSSPAAVDDGKPFGVFSAVCYLAGRRLLDLRPEVPLGLISSCWSGSMIQPWMSPTALARCPDARAVGTGAPFSQSQMYNAMINPLLNLKLASVLWHQGEENAGNPVEYRCFFTAMIEDWREQFKLPNMPFVFVQLQPCGIPPAQRYAQAAALVLPHVAMATAVDLQDAGPAGIEPCPGFNQKPTCGNPNGMCHTRWKEEIGARLAAAAARLMFNTSQLAAASAGSTAGLPPLSPSIGAVVATRSKDYRTYVVTLSVNNVDARFDSIAIGGARECTLCCNTPGFAVEYASDAAGEHWQPLGTMPDKHGVPLVFDAARKQLNITVVVEPPFKPLRFRHAWADAPQCMLFASATDNATTTMPIPPFNVTIPAAVHVHS